MAEHLVDWLLDGLLVATLLVLAWRSLASMDLFTAIVLFMGYGLIMALVWARLDAPDVALAEAAIGAGLTGALLLNAYAKTLATVDNDKSPTEGRSISKRLRLFIGVVSGGLLILPLGWAVLSLPAVSEGLRELVQNHLSQSGVSNPVTAVLLNFRGYDTLLEIAVLLLAMWAMWVVNYGGQSPTQAEQPGYSALWGLTAGLIPLLITIAGYVLWIGSSRPGGAFQAGALLAGAAIIAYISGYFKTTVSLTGVRVLSVLGLSVFIGTGVALTQFGNFLQYPPNTAGVLIITIEAAATLSIATVLAMLFMGYEPSTVSPRHIACMKPRDQENT